MVKMVSFISCIFYHSKKNKINALNIKRKVVSLCTIYCYLALYIPGKWLSGGRWP